MTDPYSERDELRPGMVPHWSDLLMPLCIGLGCWAVGIGIWVLFF